MSQYANVAQPEAPLAPLASIDLSLLPIERATTERIGNVLHILGEITGDEQPFFSLRLSDEVTSHLGARDTARLERRLAQLITSAITAAYLEAALT